MCSSLDHVIWLSDRSTCLSYAGVGLWTGEENMICPHRDTETHSLFHGEVLVSVLSDGEDIRHVLLVFLRRELTVRTQPGGRDSDQCTLDRTHSEV